MSEARHLARQRLLDKDEITDLLHRYSYYVDHKLFDRLPDLFTEDCVVDYGVAPPAHGHAAFGNFGSGLVATSSHHNANILVTFDDADHASVLASVYARRTVGG